MAAGQPVVTDVALLPPVTVFGQTRAAFGREAEPAVRAIRQHRRLWRYAPVPELRR